MPMLAFAAHLVPMLAFAAFEVACTVQRAVHLCISLWVCIPKMHTAMFCNLYVICANPREVL